MPGPPPRTARRLLLVYVAALLTLLVSAARPTGAATPEPSAGALRTCSSCSQYGLASGSSYRYVILQPWESGLIAQLKASNPGIKVLAYKDMAATYSYACKSGVDDAQQPGGVGFCWTAANHPDWFLTGSNGKPIEFCDYSGMWQMDVGSPAYQQQWLRNVGAELRSRGFDGVEIDDANQSESFHLCGRTIAKYPTKADYAAATGSFLARVAPALRAQGLLVLPNIYLEDWWNPTGSSLWDSWLSYSSGAIQEWYSKWRTDSSGWLTGADWTNRQAYLIRTEAAGKPYIGITYGPKGDAHSQEYARGSFLLDWNGGPSALVYEPTDPEAQDPYASLWTADLGSPLGSPYQVGAVWRRDYSQGAVVVNPSPNAVRVKLGGTFALPDGTLASSITVGVADAAILRSTSQPPPPPPPPPPPSAVIGSSRGKRGAAGDA